MLFRRFVLVFRGSPRAEGLSHSPIVFMRVVSIMNTLASIGERTCLDGVILSMGTACKGRCVSRQMLKRLILVHGPVTLAGG